MRPERLALYRNNGFPEPIAGMRYHGLFHHPARAVRVVICKRGARLEAKETEPC
jgi:hypothetical protein